MKPFKLITTTDPDQTLGEGEIRHYPTLLLAANAFATSTAPYKTVIYDDGCTARDLTPQEQQMLETVCGILGYDVEPV